MEEKDLSVVNRKRLDVKAVLKTSLHIFKEGLGQFMFLMLASLVMTILRIVFELAIAYSIILALVVLALMVATIYFNLRMDASIYLTARTMFQGGRLTAKEAYKSSKGLAGTYFVVSFMYGLIIVLPMLGVILSYEIADNVLLKCFLILLFSIPFAFLYTRYYLAIPSALLSVRQSGEFQSSKELVKGDFFRVLIVIIVTYGSFALASIILSTLTNYIEIEIWAAVPLIIIECALLVISVPISTIAATVMYLMLNESKNIDTLARDGEKSELQDGAQETCKLSHDENEDATNNNENPEMNLLPEKEIAI